MFNVIKELGTLAVAVVLMAVAAVFLLPYSTDAASGFQARINILPFDGMNGDSVVHVNVFRSSLLHGYGSELHQYEWNFGDPSSQHNVLQGYNASHYYQNPGIYKITLTLIDPFGRESVDTRSITIAPEDKQIIYVSPQGNDGNNGESIQKAVRTVARAAELVKDNTHVKFARGGTYTFDKKVTITAKNVTFSSYGSSTERPHLLWTGPTVKQAGGAFMFETASNSRNVIFKDLKVATKYDYATYGGDKTTTAFRLGGTNLAVINTEFRDVNSALNLETRPQAVLLQDSFAPRATDIREYLAWIQGSNITLLNNRASNSTREHIFRVGGVRSVLFAKNDIGNEDRRFLANNADQYDSAKAAFNIQKGRFAYVWKNKAKGPSAVGPLGEADGLSDKGARFQRIVIRNNEFIGNLYVNHGAEYVHVQNNLFNTTERASIQDDGYNSQYRRGTKSISIAYNVIRHSGTTGWIFKAQNLNGHSFYGNLVHAPHIEITKFDSALFYSTDTSCRNTQRMGGNMWTRPNISQSGGDMFRLGPNYQDYLSITEWSDKLDKKDVITTISNADRTKVVEGLEAGFVQTTAYKPR